MSGSFLGPQYTQGEVETSLSKLNANFNILSEQDLIEQTANLLSQGKVVGWHQGRMEFGPRALGARSILGDARSSKMQKILNLKVKFRESFRPFAPSILEDKVSNWFEYEDQVPFMMKIFKVLKEKRKLKLSST